MTTPNITATSGAVKGEIPRAIPELRAYLARHCLRPLDVARRLGVSRQYVSAVLREATPVSHEQVDRIREAIQEVQSDIEV